MDEQEALTLLSERLDTYDDPQKNFIDCVCWFADDFSRFKKLIVDEILRRIRNPPFLPRKRIDQPRLPLYYLIDAMCKNCKTDYSTLFGESLPSVFESSLKLNDRPLNDKLCNLVDYWDKEAIFPESVIEKLKESINTIYRRVVSNQSNYSTQQNPTYNMNTQSFQDDTLQEDYNLPPEEDKVQQFTIYKTQPEVSPNEIMEMENSEHHYSREWMKNAAIWETSKYDPHYELIRDLDADNLQHDDTMIQMVKVTPDNVNARCISCSGTFDRCQGPNGEECLKDAIYEEGRGYIHQQCKKYQASDSNAELLRFLLQK